MVRRRRGCVIVLWFLLLFGFLQHGSAQVPACTVTQHDDQTTYTIVAHSPDGPLISVVKGCEYTWANATQHVMAHNHDKAPELVLTNNINTLVTSRCIDKVIYTRSCVSEGEPCTIYCTTSCHGSALRDKVFTPSSIALIIIPLLLLVVVVVGVLGFLCYRPKNEAPSSDESSRGYQTVQMEVDPKAADVEAKGAGRCFS